MATLTVTPGPIPQDGEKIRPVTDLPAFVNGTTVADLPSDAFGGDLTFIGSQTEPPGVIFPGHMWFKRGEGQLYWAQSVDSSVYTSVWCKFAPTFEMLAVVDESSFSAFPGQPVTLGQDSYLDQMYQSTDGVDRLTWKVNTHVVSSGASLVATMGTRFVLVDTCITKSQARVVVWGMCDARFSSGVSSARANHIAAVTSIWEDRGVEKSLFGAFQPETRHTGTFVHGLIVDHSGVSADISMRSVYKFVSPFRLG